MFYDLTVEISNQDNYSGVVIAGYGIDEIYPVIYELRIAEFFDKRLRHDLKNSEYINDDVTAIVAPIAQRDMVDTFVLGGAPNVLNNISKCLSSELQNALIDIDSLIKDKKAPKVKKRLMEIHTKVGKSLEKYQEKRHKGPMLRTVSFLSKEGMIELAESLVNITSLKRKTSSETESVGGPVDIVIITKTDGFIWIKNKSVIDQKLNQHFYSRLEKVIWDHKN